MSSSSCGGTCCRRLSNRLRRRRAAHRGLYDVHSGAVSRNRSGNRRGSRRSGDASRGGPVGSNARLQIRTYTRDGGSNGGWLGRLRRTRSGSRSRRIEIRDDDRGKHASCSWYSRLRRGCLNSTRRGSIGLRRGRRRNGGASVRVNDTAGRGHRRRWYAGRRSLNRDDAWSSRSRDRILGLSLCRDAGPEGVGNVCRRAGQGLEDGARSCARGYIWRGRLGRTVTCQTTCSYTMSVVQISLPRSIRDGRGVEYGSFRSFSFEPITKKSISTMISRSEEASRSPLTAWGRGVATDQPGQAQQPGSCPEHCQRVCDNALCRGGMCRSHSDVLIQEEKKKKRKKEFGDGKDQQIDTFLCVPVSGCLNK